MCFEIYENENQIREAYANIEAENEFGVHCLVNAIILSFYCKYCNFNLGPDFNPDFEFQIF